MQAGASQMLGGAMLRALRAVSQGDRPLARRPRPPRRLALGSRGAVDRRLKDPARRVGDLHQLDAQVRSYADMVDAELLLRRLPESAVDDLDAKRGPVRLAANGDLRTMHKAGTWCGAAEIVIQLVARGQRIGFMRLGPRRSGQVCDELDFGAPVQITGVIARAIARTRPASRASAPAA